MRASRMSKAGRGGRLGAEQRLAAAGAALKSAMRHAPDEHRMCLS
jgi:hypothetical protein